MDEMTTTAGGGGNSEAGEYTLYCRYSIDQQGGQVDPCPQNFKLGRTAEEAQAEARLFEAAHKLLEACEAVLTEHEKSVAAWSAQSVFGYPVTVVEPPYLPVLRAAIAAAKGQE